MEKLKQISPIRDVVHNYMSFSPFEREVIDSPHFQILHFVLQNSAAYTAYPANKNSRYIHSLGVSHLCGRIFIQSLKNANSETLHHFLRDAAKHIALTAARINYSSTVKKELNSAWERNIGNSSRFLHNPIYGDRLDLDDNHLDFNPLFIINTIWIALKIVGLVHDIGHLPMSHLFEDALEVLEDSVAAENSDSEGRILLDSLSGVSSSDVFSASSPNAEVSLNWICQTLGIGETEFEENLSEFAIHEIRSLQILDDIYANPPSPAETAKGREDAEYRQLVFSLATVINFTTQNSNNEPKAQFLRYLKQIVSSELDADRLDYTIRDPLSSGLELGKFDLDRIVSNFTLAHRIENGEIVYELAITEKCISAVENFFHQRYLNYSTLIYHRTAIKYKGILRESIKWMYIIAMRDPKGEVAEILRRNGFLTLDSRRSRVTSFLPSTKMQSYAFDDARLRSTLFEILEVTQKETVNPLQDRGIDGDLNRLSTLISTFIFRKKENILSFGKGFTNILQERRKFKLGGEGAQAFSTGGAIKADELASFVREKQISLDEAGGGQVTIILSMLSPKIYLGAGNARKSILVATPSLDDENDTILIPIHDISSYLKDHTKLASEDRDFSISFVADGIRGSSEQMADCEQIYGEILHKILALKKI